MSATLYFVSANPQQNVRDVAVPLYIRKYVDSTYLICRLMQLEAQLCLFEEWVSLYADVLLLSTRGIDTAGWEPLDLLHS